MSILPNGSEQKVNREPVALANGAADVLRAIIPLGLVFHLINWTPEQIAAVLLAVTTIITFFQTYFVRSRVTPVSAPQLPVGTTVIGTDNGKPVSATLVE